MQSSRSSTRIKCCQDRVRHQTAACFANRPMAVEAGTQLGPYEILAPLGAGGMGEVYKAKDTRLDRTVAIKVLPSHLSDDARLKERFQREARVVSSLNHPHICTLHDIHFRPHGRRGRDDDDIDYMVLEYLEGETLADRLEKGALPLDEALRRAMEIADALDKAHRHGVVHRDLKPANIMLTESRAKLLDFGLATRLRQPVLRSLDDGGSDLMTEEKPLTAEGAILGTLQYMAPEQLEGREADPRSDIFALGAVLYEMVTGRKAFEGKSQASLISAIMKDEPAPVSQLHAMSPSTLDHLIRRCLVKEPDARWQSAAELMSALNWIAETYPNAGATAPLTAAPKSAGGGLDIGTAVAAAALFGGLVALAIWERR